MKEESFPRWGIAVMLIVILGILGLGISFYRSEAVHLRSDAEAQLAAIARLKVDQISQWRRERLSDASVLLENAAFVRAVVGWLHAPPGEAPDSGFLLETFGSLQKHYGYHDVLLVDAQQHVRLSLSGQGGPLHERAMRTLDDVWRQGRPAMTDLHAGPDDLAPHIDTVAPLLSNDRQTVEGAIVLQSDARQFLYPLIQSWPTPSGSAETLLVRQEGNHVLFLNQVRHLAGTALTMRLPMAQEDLPAVMAARGIRGIVLGKDYRGVEVLAYLASVPDSPWLMVSKVDAAEALSVAHRQSAQVLAAMLALGIATVAAGGYVWQRTRESHYRALLQAEISQRQMEERYRTTLLSVGDGVIVTDAQGRVELLNPVAETLTGWSQEEARFEVLDAVFRIRNEQTGQRAESPVARVVREGRVVGLANHTVLVAKDGVERPIADSGAPVRDENGRVTGVVLVFRDQTEERAAQKELAESKAALEKAQQVAHVGSWAWHIQKNRVEWSDEMFRIFGLDRASFRGDLAEILQSAIHPDDLEAVRASNLSVIQQQEPIPLEYRVIRPGGEVRTVWAQAGELILDEAGTPALLTGIVQDITARKRAEEEQKRLQDQLVQAQKMETVGRLAGGVAHDFNNMLSAILGYVHFALEQVEPESSLYSDLQAIRQASERSASLTNQLLAFARRQTIAPRNLDLNEAVEGTLKMLRRVIGEETELVWLPGRNLWPISMDPVQLDQILANLAVNARDAIDGLGRISIETENVTVDASYAASHLELRAGEYVVLSVSDNGRGMSAEVLEHLFEPFFTTKGVGEGTGLGLAMVYGIVRQNQGAINVYSEPGEGTTFKVYLPRAVTQVDNDRPERSEAPRGGTETLLVVEDELAVLRLCQRVLGRLGYTVLGASSPASAIDLAKEHDGAIHLLLTDVVMPEMTGKELAECLRPLYPGIQELYMSGYTSDIITHRGVLDRGIRFVQKPFTANALATKVREILDETGAREA